MKLEWIIQRPSWVMRALSEFELRPTVVVSESARCLWCHGPKPISRPKYCSRRCVQAAVQARRPKLSNRRERW